MALMLFWGSAERKMTAYEAPRDAIDTTGGLQDPASPRQKVEIPSLFRSNLRTTMGHFR